MLVVSKTLQPSVHALIICNGMDFQGACSEFCNVASIYVSKSGMAIAPHEALTIYLQFTPLWQSRKHQYSVSAVQNILCKFPVAL